MIKWLKRHFDSYRINLCVENIWPCHTQQSAANEAKRYFLLIVARKRKCVACDCYWATAYFNRDLTNFDPSLWVFFFLFWWDFVRFLFWFGREPLLHVCIPIVYWTCILPDFAVRCFFLNFWWPVTVIQPSTFILHCEVFRTSFLRAFLYIYIYICFSTCALALFKHLMEAERIQRKWTQPNTLRK